MTLEQKINSAIALLAAMIAKDLPKGSGGFVPHGNSQNLEQQLDEVLSPKAVQSSLGVETRSKRAA